MRPRGGDIDKVDIILFSRELTSNGLPRSIPILSFLPSGRQRELRALVGLNGVRIAEADRADHAKRRSHRLN
jgi:hypothetical protein